MKVEGQQEDKGVKLIYR